VSEKSRQRDEEDEREGVKREKEGRERDNGWERNNVVWWEEEEEDWS